MRYIKIKLVIACVSFIGEGYSQSKIETTSTVNIQLEGTYVITNILSDYNFTPLVQENKTYYWFKSGVIRKNQGGYNGKLLHGKYIECYYDKSLKQVGYFSYGLKNGSWKDWYINGNLQESSNWKEGILEGPCKRWDEAGLLVFEGRYKNGKRQGIFKEMINGCVVYSKYKNGRFIQNKKTFYLNGNSKNNNQN